MEDSKIQALIDMSYTELPDKWDNETPFTKGIALVKRVGGQTNYVLVQKKFDKILVTKDYNGGEIFKMLEVYPCEKREELIHGNHERLIGVWCTLRTPNKTLESKDEKIHLR